MFRKSALAFVAAATLLASCNPNEPSAVAADFYATDGDTLFKLNTHSALNARAVELSGLTSGSLIYAIDSNPRGGGLTGLGSDGQSYSIDPVTGVATPKGSPDTSVSLINKAVEIDYNPVAGANTANEGKVYRVTTSTGDNVRRNDTTGAKLGTDSAFVYKTGDVNAGKSVVISGIAYSNSQINSTLPAGSSTTVYAIDSQNDVLTVLGGNPGDAATCPNATNPNCGQLTTVGPLGVDVGGFVGFDIYGANAAFATTFAEGTYNLYSVDLSTGLMTFISGVNPKIVPVRSIAFVQP